MEYTCAETSFKDGHIDTVINYNDKPHIKDSVIKKWQDIVDIIPTAFNALSGLIMHPEGDKISVFLTSKNKDNPYKRGDREKVLIGLYCETVYGDRKSLIIPNVLEDPLYDKSSNANLNLVSYMGIPILWPDGDIFGTLCVIDNKENNYNNYFIKLIEIFRDNVEKDLKYIFEREKLKKEIDRRKKLENILRENQSKYKELFNNMSSAVVILRVENDGEDFIFEDMNRTAELIEKLKKRDVKEKNIKDLYPTAEKAGFLGIMKEVWKTGTSKHLAPLYYEDSRIKGWRENYHIYKFSSNKIVSMYDDVSEKISYQNIINEKERLIFEKYEYEKIRNEFFANISHELRTPLNVILSAIQLMELKEGEYNDLNAFLPRYLGMMKQNCYRLVRLVNNIIDMTKIDADYFEVHLENTDIVPLAREISLSVGDYVSNKGVKLSFNTDIEKGIIALDPDKIETIILNLLSNAVKFTEPGDSISVNVSRNDGWIAISVKDTGIGIPEDKLGIIFERFRQVDKSLTRDHEGSGIGLSLVKSIVEKHKGKIYAKSEYGKGSEFIVELPDTVLHIETVNKSNWKKELDNSRIKKIKIEFSDIYNL